MQNAALWSRLQAHPFALYGPAPTLAADLARVTALKPDQIAAALTEYRRFLILLADDPATMPPPLLALIWRRHVADTRAYVDDLCLPFFGHVLHHAPSSEKPAQHPRYAATLARYRAAFGAPHPKVWPSQRVLAWQAYMGLPFILGLALALYGGLEGGAAQVVAGIALAVIPLMIWIAVGPWPTAIRISGDAGDGPDGSDGDGGGGD